MWAIPSNLQLKHWIRWSTSVKFHQIGFIFSDTKRKWQKMPNWSAITSTPKWADHIHPSSLTTHPTCSFADANLYGWLDVLSKSPQTLLEEWWRIFLILANDFGSKLFSRWNRNRPTDDDDEKRKTLPSLSNWIYSRAKKKKKIKWRRHHPCTIRITICRSHYIDRRIDNKQHCRRNSIDGNDNNDVVVVVVAIIERWWRRQRWRKQIVCVSVSMNVCIVHARRIGPISFAVWNLIWWNPNIQFIAELFGKSTKSWQCVNKYRIHSIPIEFPIHFFLSLFVSSHEYPHPAISRFDCQLNIFTFIWFACFAFMLKLTRSRRCDNIPSDSIAQYPYPYPCIEPNFDEE